MKTNNASPCLPEVDKTKWAKRCSYIGVFVLLITRCLPWYWGNLSVYTASYFQHRLGPDPEITAPWVISLWIVGMGIGQMVAGLIAEFIGRKWTVVFGCVLVDSGLFLSVLSLQHSMKSLNLSLGLVGGLGTGVLITIGLEHALSFPAKYPGMVTAFLMSGSVAGGACFNQLITWYINPNNLVPDFLENRHYYFTQPEVLDRVTPVYLVLGVAHLCCHALGMLLIRPNVEKKLEDGGDHMPNANKDADDAEKVNGKPFDVAKCPTETMDTKEAFLMKNVSMTEMVKTKTFYVLWSAALCSHYGYITNANYFKIYGQTQISDDQFLTNVASCMLLASIPSRLLWGGLIDACDIKLTVIILNCILCVLSNFLYFTPMLSKWLFFVWTVMYGSTTTGFYLVFSVATLKLFGKEHFSKNYGLMMSCTIFLNVFVPTVIQAVISSCGWFYLFFSVGCSNAFGVILVLLWLPQK